MAVVLGTAASTGVAWCCSSIKRSMPLYSTPFLQTMLGIICLLGSWYMQERGEGGHLPRCARRHPGALYRKAPRARRRRRGIPPGGAHWNGHRCREMHTCGLETLCCGEGSREGSQGRAASWHLHRTFRCHSPATVARPALPKDGATAMRLATLQQCACWLSAGHHPHCRHPLCSHPHCHPAQVEAKLAAERKGHKGHAGHTTEHHVSGELR